MSRYQQIKDKFYANADFELLNIDDYPIPFSNDWKKIGVKISGGADSACMTMLLASEIQKRGLDTKIIPVSFLRCWDNRPWQIDILESVLKTLHNKFPGIISDQSEYSFMPSSIDGHVVTEMDNRTVFGITGYEFARYLVTRKNFNAVFNVTTAAPPVILPQEAEFVKARRKTVADDFDMYGGPGNGNYVFTPMLLENKAWIIKQYIDNNWLDVLEMTQSCEADISDSEREQVRIDGRYVSRPPCGECWWCQERKWALNENGL